MNAACQCLFGETVVQIPPENAIASNKPHAENALIIRRSQNNVRVSRLFVSLSSSTARLCFDVRIEKGVVLCATSTYGVLSLRSIHRYRTFGVRFPHPMPQDVKVRLQLSMESLLCMLYEGLINTLITTIYATLTRQLFSYLAVSIMSHQLDALESLRAFTCVRVRLFVSRCNLSLCLFSSSSPYISFPLTK